MNPNIKVIFGAEGIKEAYELTLNSKKLDIVCFAKNYQEITGDHFEKEYMPKLSRLSIQTREILQDSTENREYAKKKDCRKNQVRFLKLRKPSESDLILKENEAVLVSYDKATPFSLVICDPNLIANFQNQFDTLWNKL